MDLPGYYPLGNGGVHVGDDMDVVDRTLSKLLCRFLRRCADRYLRQYIEFQRHASPRSLKGRKRINRPAVRNTMQMNFVLAQQFEKPSCKINVSGYAIQIVDNDGMHLASLYHSDELLKSGATATPTGRARIAEQKVWFSVEYSARVFRAAIGLFLTLPRVIQTSPDVGSDQL